MMAGGTGLFWFTCSASVFSQTARLAGIQEACLDEGARTRERGSEGLPGPESAPAFPIQAPSSLRVQLTTPVAAGPVLMLSSHL